MALNKTSNSESVAFVNPGFSEADLQTAIKAVTADWLLLKMSKSTRRVSISFLGKYFGCKSSTSSSPDSSIPDPSRPECSLMIAKPAKKEVG